MGGLWFQALPCEAPLGSPWGEGESEAGFDRGIRSPGGLQHTLVNRIDPGRIGNHVVCGHGQHRGKKQKITQEAEPPDKEIHLQCYYRAHPRRVERSSLAMKVDAHASPIDLKADDQGAAERQQKAVSPCSLEKVRKSQVIDHAARARPRREMT